MLVERMEREDGRVGGGCWVYELEPRLTLRDV